MTMDVLKGARRVITLNTLVIVIVTSCERLLESVGPFSDVVGDEIWRWLGSTIRPSEGQLRRQGQLAAGACHDEIDKRAVGPASFHPTCPAIALRFGIMALRGSSPVRVVWSDCSHTNPSD